MMFSKEKRVIMLAISLLSSALLASSDWETAAELRKNDEIDKAEVILKKYSSPAGFEQLKPSEKTEFLRGLLELAHIRALKDDVVGALALLNWAEGRSDAYLRSIACVKYAEVLLDLSEFERAQGYLANADELIKTRAIDSKNGIAIGQGGENIDTGSAWRELRNESDALKADIESEEMKTKFGATYGNYVKLRRLQQIAKRACIPRYRNEAIRIADDIITTDPASQFAAAAEYLKGELMAARLTEDSDKKEIKKVKDYLEKFVNAHPEGLYRGEALMLLGKTSLEIEWDAKDAESFYTQALDYFRKARDKRDAVSLYAAISDDLKSQIEPTQKPTTLNEWKRIVYHDEDPLKLYNTTNAPVWYIDDKEKNVLLILGLIRFSKGDFNGAAEVWEKVKPLDRNIADMDPRLPNIYTRLISACNVKHMMFTLEEKRNIRNSNLRLKVQYAEYLFLQEKFDEAQTRFKNLLKLVKDDETKAVLLIGVADCTEIAAQGNYKQASAKLYEQIIRNEKLKRSDVYALAIFRYAMSLWGTVPGQKRAYGYCMEYTKAFPNGRNFREAQFHAIRYLILNNKQNEARRELVDFSKIDDGYARYLNNLMKRGEEK